jgi:HPt (histidine-containing phosphotransfer) domain-containing protein
LKGAAANLGAQQLARAAEHLIGALSQADATAAALTDLSGRWEELRIELLARGYIAGP